MTKKEWLSLGCVDGPEEVAECLNCPRFPLPCNNCHNGKATVGHSGDPNWDKARAKQLWDMGLNDKDISKTIGVTKETIHRWRVRNGLENNFNMKKGAKGHE